MAGVEFQRKWEHAAWESGGREGRAPRNGRQPEQQDRQGEEQGQGQAAQQAGPELDALVAEYGRQYAMNVAADAEEGVENPKTVQEYFDGFMGIGETDAVTEVARQSLMEQAQDFADIVTFQKEMGGNARKGVLFEGPPGTGSQSRARPSMNPLMCSSPGASTRSSSSRRSDRERVRITNVPNSVNI